VARALAYEYGKLKEEQVEVIEKALVFYFLFYSFSSHNMIDVVSPFNSISVSITVVISTRSTCLIDIIII